MAVLGNLPLDFPAGGVVRQAFASLGWADESDQPSLLGNGLKLDLFASHGQSQITGREVPT